MTTALMLLALTYKTPEHKDLPLYEAPQVVCPTDLVEYLEWYKPWARNEIRRNQRPEVLNHLMDSIKFGI